MVLKPGNCDPTLVNIKVPLKGGCRGEGSNMIPGLHGKGMKEGAFTHFHLQKAPGDTGSIVHPSLVLLKFRK